METIIDGEDFMELVQLVASDKKNSHFSLANIIDQILVNEKKINFSIDLD